MQHFVRAKEKGVKKMDECVLTIEQVRSLSEGESVEVVYKTLEDRGEIRTNRIKLVMEYK